MICGSAAVGWMPAGAAQTTRTAFTARLAVKPGDASPIRSIGTAKRISMSSGASPSTTTCQPVARRSQSWSRSRAGDAKGASNQSGERGVLESETRPVFREETL